MFLRLFAESGLSLDRLKALLEVGASGSIAKAADFEPVRQSQYSRQIKELEDFFRVKLIERQGRGTRLTASGKELARISRFFLLGLSNFQRGCLAEEQSFRFGTSPTFNHHFLIPALSELQVHNKGPSFATEILSDADIERRLHELTIDFGIVSASSLSRPLQLFRIGEWPLTLCAAKTQYPNRAGILKLFHNRKLPFLLAALETPQNCRLAGFETRLACDSFVEIKSALRRIAAAAFLPQYFVKEAALNDLLCIEPPNLPVCKISYSLAWNPRLLRLNPHAARLRDALKLRLEASAANSHA